MRNIYKSVTVHHQDEGLLATQPNVFTSGVDKNQLLLTDITSLLLKKKVYESISMQSEHLILL